MSVVKLFPAKTACQVIPDTEHNQNREDQGPPIGEAAWMCAACEDFAFYVKPDGIYCYRCRAVQGF